MTVKELMKCLEGIDENLQVLIPCENAYVAINHVALSLLRREHDDEYLRAVALSYNADKGEQKKKPKDMMDKKETRK